MNCLFFIFCFLNLYGPISTNIPFAFNLIFFIAVNSKRMRVAYERIFVTIPVFLLIIAIIAVMFTRAPEKDYSVIGLYLRMLVNCAVFPPIIYFFYQKKTKILEIISLTLFLHCVMVLCQMIFPSLQELNHLFFRYSREAEILENLTMRRLGLTGGYDSSGLYAAISSVFALELSYLTSKKKYTFFSILSLMASLFTSRTGMAAAFLSIILCALFNRKATVKRFGSTFLYMAILSLSLTYFVLPVILSTMGLSSGSELDYEDYGYGSKTGERLLVDHLLPLEILNTRELFLGYGGEIRKALWLSYSSDIGYVKQIYEVGIVGVVLMVYFSVLMAVRTYLRHKMIKYNMDLKVGSQLMFMLLLLYLFFDYKNQLLYNVCIFEVYLFVYYYCLCHFMKLKGELNKKSIIS